jgi:hypothetical protein
MPDVILESIRAGIRRLEQKGHYGEYCVVVSRDLYEAAFRPHSMPVQDGEPLSFAPINRIRPLLREGGFLYSPMAEPGTGAIFSLGGGEIGIAVPREAHIAYVGMDRDVILSVQERVRLLIKNPEAYRLLETPGSVPEVREPSGSPLKVWFDKDSVPAGEYATLSVRYNVPAGRDDRETWVRLHSSHQHLFPVPDNLLEVNTSSDDRAFKRVAGPRVDEPIEVTVQAKCEWDDAEAKLTIQPREDPTQKPAAESAVRTGAEPKQD